jgi:hypothetical protein
MSRFVVDTSYLCHVSSRKWVEKGGRLKEQPKRSAGGGREERRAYLDTSQVEYDRIGYLCRNWPNIVRRLYVGRKSSREREKKKAVQQNANVPKKSRTDKRGNVLAWLVGKIYCSVDRGTRRCSGCFLAPPSSRGTPRCTHPCPGCPSSGLDHTDFNAFGGALSP